MMKGVETGNSTELRSPSAPHDQGWHGQALFELANSSFLMWGAARERTSLQATVGSLSEIQQSYSDGSETMGRRPFILFRNSVPFRMDPSLYDAELWFTNASFLTSESF